MAALPALRHGRHRARHREQPGGVHHLAGGRAHLALSDRRGAGRGRAGVPRERRRPRSGACTSSGWRSTTGSGSSATCSWTWCATASTGTTRLDDPTFTQPVMYRKVAAHPHGLAALRRAARARGRARRRPGSRPLRGELDAAFQAAHQRARAGRRRARLARAGRRLEGVRVGRRGLDGGDRACRASGSSRWRARSPRCRPGSIRTARSRPSRPSALKMLRAGPRGLGAGRGARARHAAARGPPPAPERAGHRARHLQPPPRGAARRGGRRACTCRSQHLAAGAGPLRDLRHAAGRVGAASASSTATARPTRSTLVVWEAQFGDFVNVAQVYLDQFLASAESQVAAHVRPDAAAAARLRGPGAGALERAARALPASSARAATCRS